MHRTTIDQMYEQLRSLYHALTGGELPVHAQLPTTTPAFVPPIDVLEHDHELIVELAVPGVTQNDLRVESAPGVLVVSGVRAGEPANGHTYRHAEIPRGPFRRVIFLGPEVVGEPKRVELANGVAKIHLAKVTSPVAKA